MTKRKINGAGRRRAKKAVPKRRRSRDVVGAQRKLSTDDKKTAQAAKASIDQARRELGAERARYLDTESRLLIDLRGAEEQYRNVVMTLAKKHGIEPEGDENWTLNATTMVFTRNQ